MREELELIKKIEDYINGQLSDVEKTAFEEQIAGNAQLGTEVGLQRDIMLGIERITIKQMIQRAAIKYRLRQHLIRWGLGGLFIILIILAALLYAGKVRHNKQVPRGYSIEKIDSNKNVVTRDTLPEQNEAGNKIWADADRNIKAQIFLLNTSADTVIETKGGIILSVPAKGFMDENGDIVDGDVELTIKEALTPATIMSAGLSGTSEGRLLESGGMFFADARQNGKILKINPANSIYVQIPADSVKAGMQLFKGKRLPDGTIDWVTPKPLVHDLVPADILSLDFYPPGYRDSLAKWGYDARNKKFTDSLYYSLTALFGYGDNPGLLSKIQPVDSLTVVDIDGSTISCGVNPAKIKTIWSEKFQNTLLATHEFEQRLYWLHKTGNDVAFDLYVNNLDKPMSAIDAMVASRSMGRLKEIFLRFATANAGKVNNGLKQFKKLQEYYRKKTKLFMEAISKTQAEFQSKQLQLDRIAASKQNRHLDDSAKHAGENFREEFDINLKKAYQQLGYKDVPPRSAAVGLNRPNVYTAQISSTGWCNVDRFIAESITKRTTLNFTDKQTGKKAVIKYLPASFSINNPNTYNRLYVYLLPDKLSSYMRLKDSSGKYAENLNELMKYNLICLGYKGQKLFLYGQKNIQSRHYPSINLIDANEAELEHLVNGFANATQSSAFINENSFLAYEVKDQERRKHNLALQQLSIKLITFIFPCYGHPLPVSPAAKSAAPAMETDRRQEQ